MPCNVLRLSPCTEQPHPLVSHVTGDMKRRESNETRYSYWPHRENIIPQFAMDGVREKLAVVVFLVCWSSQVEAQGQGKQLYH